MSDANVAVSFSASVGDLVSGVSEARDALAGLSSPLEQLNGQYATLGASMGHAFDPSRLKSYDSALSASASLEASLAASHALTKEDFPTRLISLDWVLEDDALRTRLADNDDASAPDTSTCYRIIMLL